MNVKELKAQLDKGGFVVVSRAAWLKLLDELDRDRINLKCKISIRVGWVTLGNGNISWDDPCWQVS